MICFPIYKNGVLVCKAGVADQMILAAHVRGSRFDESAGFFSVSGMQDLPDQRSTHVYWVSDEVLNPGDSLVFTLIDHDAPDAPATVTATDSPGYLDDQRDYDAFEQGHMGPEPFRPVMRSSLSYKVVFRGEEILVQVPDEHAHMMCNVLWDRWSPDHFNFSASSFPSAESGLVNVTKEWVHIKLGLGELVEITVLA